MKVTIADSIKKSSLHRLLAVAFVGEILLFAVLAAFLSYASGLKTTTENARQIASVASDDVTKMVLDYVAEPYQLEQINRHMILNKELNYSDQAQRDRYFVEILKAFPQVTNTALVLANGNEYGVRREDNGSFLVWSGDQERQVLDYFRYDETLGRTEYVKSLTDYNPIKRPSYLKATSMRNPGWTDVYYSATGRGLVITKICPLYIGNEELLGVHSCSILLNKFNDFLQSLMLTENAVAFIVSNSDEVIASSDKKGNSVRKATVLTRVNEYPLLEQGLKTLKERESVEPKTNGAEDISFSFAGEKFYMHMAPITGAHGLQWTNVVIIPENDLLYPLYALLNKVIGSTVIACVLALVAGLLAARYIVRPIVKVEEAAKKITEGDFSSKIKVKYHDEIGELSNAVNMMSEKLKYQLELKRKATSVEKKLREHGAAMHQVIGRFVPYGFLDLLDKNNISEIVPGDRIEKEITVLFTDIRSFTKISEGMSSVELFEFVNRYLDLAVDVITQNNGFVDKFIGDAIMALFPGGSEDALQAIVGIRQEILRRGLLYKGEPLKIGAGIHFGNVMLGTVGTYTRMDTTVLGDSVNLASRIESATKVYGIDVLISEPAYYQLKNPGNFYIREIDTVKVKGKSRPIKLYEVFDCDSEELKLCKKKIEVLFKEGLQLYKEGVFEQAEEIFRQCQEQCPEDQLLTVYVKRCGTMRRVPPGPDWQGISGI